MKRKKQFLPQRKTKYELLEVIFTYWATKFGVPGIKVERDNRYNGHLITEAYEDGRVRLLYNVRKLGTWSYANVVSGVFHELGHVLMDMPYDSEKQQIRSEFEAEVFSLQCLKCFYPQFVKEVCEHVKKKLVDNRWKKMYPIHYEAFSMIKDFQ